MARCTRAGPQNDEGKAILNLKSRPQIQTASAPALLALIEKTLDDGKAENITVIELIGKSSIADYMVIASGRSQRQVVALAENLHEKLDAACPYPVSVEGLPQGDWVLIDAGDIIVHIFRPEVRAYYNLEKMWGSDLFEPTPAESGSDKIFNPAEKPLLAVASITESAVE
jgi:ribosome-associated protein